MSTLPKQESSADVRKQVRQHYGQIAAESQGRAQKGCCSSSTTSVDLIYETPDVGSLPAEVTGLFVH